MTMLLTAPTVNLKVNSGLSSKNESKMNGFT